MRTKTSVFEVKAKNGKVEIVVGKRGGEQVSLLVSTTKAFALYQQLLGRRGATGVRVGIISLLVHEFTPREKEEGGKGTQRVVVRRGEERITALLLSPVGSVLLAEEVKGAVRKAMEEGGKVEVATGDFYALADRSGVRVGYKDVPLFVPLRSLVVFKVALQGKYEFKVGELLWDGKRFFLKGREIPEEGEKVLVGLIEVMG